MTDWLWWAIGIGTIALGLAIAYGIVKLVAVAGRPRHGAKRRPIACIGKKIRHPSGNALSNLNSRNDTRTIGFPIRNAALSHLRGL